MAIGSSRWGVRTFGMLVCAYIWVLLGVGALKEISVVHPGVFHLDIPGSVRGALWLFSAALAVGCAWSRRASSVAIGVLFVMPGLQMVSYALGWALHIIPGGNPGYSNGWYASALYLALIALVVLTALIPSPPVTQVRLLRERGE